MRQMPVHLATTNPINNLVALTKICEDLAEINSRGRTVHSQFVPEERGPSVILQDGGSFYVKVTEDLKPKNPQEVQNLELLLSNKFNAEIKFSDWRGIPTISGQFRDNG